MPNPLIPAAATGLSEILPRRAFLAGLARLPLIGGSIAILGAPVRADVPVNSALLHSYKNWLFMEHRMLSYELANHDVKAADEIEHYFVAGNEGCRWHFHLPSTNGNRQGPAGWDSAPQPSSRAAAVLSAVGCDWTR